MVNCVYIKLHNLFTKTIVRAKRFR